MKRGGRQIQCHTMGGGGILHVIHPLLRNLALRPRPLLTYVTCTTMVLRCATTATLLAIMCSPAVSWTTLRAAVISSGSTRQRHVQARASSSFRAVTRSRGSGVRVLRMGAAEDAIEEEVRAMRASQIKKTLEEMSVGTKGVYEVR